MMMKNISEVVSSGLCAGCGLCHDICHKNCISIQNKRGYRRAFVDEASCVHCGLCTKLCPGKDVPIKRLSEKLWLPEKDVKYDAHLGYYLSCYAAYSTNDEIRYQCTSGGVVSGLLLYLIEKGIIDGAVEVGFSEKDPTEPYAFIARNAKDILAAKGAKYCMSSYENTVREILRGEIAKYVVIGLPCHIHGFRKYAGLSSLLKKRIIGCFSLYCSANKSRLSQDYMFWRYGVKREKISNFRYRGEGYLGSMVAKDGAGHTILQKECLQYYMPLRGFFNSPRCSLCIDHYGELADISFGDLNIGKYAEDRIGISSLIVRSPKWHKILQNAVTEGYLFMEEITPELLKSSQLYAFKHKKGPGVVAAFSVRKSMGMKVPHYDVEPDSPLRLKFIIREFGNYLCRFIGRHKHLWFIIKRLDRNR